MLNGDVTVNCDGSDCGPCNGLSTGELCILDCTNTEICKSVYIINIINCHSKEIYNIL